MARIRSIKPTFFTSLTITSLPIPTRLTFIGLWTYVDDAGRGVDDSRLVKAELWPLDDNYTARKVDADLDTLQEAGLILRYTAGQRHYLQITGWTEHQRINRPAPSRIPEPSGGLTEDSVSPHGTISEPSPREGKGKEGKGKDSVKPHGRFAEFWMAYPLKVSKGQAERAWNAATKSADEDDIIAGATRYANDPRRHPQFTKHAGTWLNAKGWLDELPSVGIRYDVPADIIR